LLFGGEDCDKLCDAVHNRLNNIVEEETAAPSPLPGSDRSINDPISLSSTDTSHADTKDTSATGLKKSTSGSNLPRNHVADVNTRIALLSRPFDGLCGIERDTIINERGERLVSISSRRCETAKTIYERCVLRSHDSGKVGRMLDESIRSCDRKYDIACPKICRKSERLTCADLSDQLSLLSTRAKKTKLGHKLHTDEPQDIKT
jgi:galactokinase